MLAIVLVTVPFFALIGAGYVAVRSRVLPLEAIGGLNTFVLFFALPCMLFRFGASTPIAQLLDGSVALVWGVCALTLVGAVVWGTRSARIGWNDAAFGALVAAFPNTGFMGVPLLAALLGPAATGPVIITIAFDMVVTSSLCIALSRLDGVSGVSGVSGAGGVGAGSRGGGGQGANERRSARHARLPAAAQANVPGLGRSGAAQAVRQALRGMFVNPLPGSILLGALASALQFKLYAPIDRTLAMLADAASPAALFTIGAVLARSALVGRAAHRAASTAGAPTDRAAQPAARAAQPGFTRIGDVLPVVLVKLIVHPLLVWAVARGAIALGLPLSEPARVAIVLVAALSSASNVAMLAERFGADNGRIAQIILWTTVAAFFTFPLAVVGLRP